MSNIVSWGEASKRARDEQIVTWADEGVRWTFEGAHHETLKAEANQLGAKWTGDWWVFPNKGTRKALLDFARSLDLEVCAATRMLEGCAVRLAPGGEKGWELRLPDTAFRRAIAGHFHRFIERNKALSILPRYDGHWVLETDRIGARQMSEWLTRRRAKITVSRGARLPDEGSDSGREPVDERRGGGLTAVRRALVRQWHALLARLRGQDGRPEATPDERVCGMIVHGRRRRRHH